jgi:hypothetical protein
MPGYKCHHVYEITFNVVSDEHDASDVTPKMLKKALKQRVRDVFAKGGVGHSACTLSHSIMRRMPVKKGTKK